MTADLAFDRRDPHDPFDARARRAGAAVRAASEQVPSRPAPRPRAGGWVAAVAVLLVLAVVLLAGVRPRPTVSTGDVPPVDRAPVLTTVPSPVHPTVIPADQADPARRARGLATVDRLLARVPATHDVHILAYGGEGEGEWIETVSLQPMLRTPAEALGNRALGGAAVQPDCIAHELLLTDPAQPVPPWPGDPRACHQPGSVGRGGFGGWSNQGALIDFGEAPPGTVRVDAVVDGRVVRSSPAFDTFGMDPDRLAPWATYEDGADHYRMVDAAGNLLDEVDLHHQMGPEANGGPPTSAFPVPPPG